MIGRILVTPRSLSEVGLGSVPELALLRERGYELVSGPAGRTPTREELLALTPGIVGWLAGVERISAEVLHAATSLKVISRNGVGTDGVDLDAARQVGIRVERAVGANSQGVAELALTVTMMALRHVSASAAALREGRWERRQGVELADCTVGVVGLGAIGRLSSRAFAGLGARVIGFDPFVGEIEGVELVSFEELFTASDIVTLHCPPSADGSPIVTATEIRLMRAGSVLVNTARACLVDEDAVLTALDNGHLDAYAVDAFDSEPPEPSRLLSHPQVIATPHLGGYTTASVRRATAQAVQNLLMVLDGVG